MAAISDNRVKFFDDEILQIVPKTDKNDQPYLHLTVKHRGISWGVLYFAENLDVNAVMTAAAEKPLWLVGKSVNGVFSGVIDDEPPSTRV